MKKIIVLTAVLLITISAISFAQTGTLQGTWLWKCDYQLNGKLDGHISLNDVNFTTGQSQFIGKYNQTALVGEIYYAKTHYVITFFQFTEGDCIAAHGGIMVNPEKIFGTWYGLNGQSGDFELVKE